MRTLLTAALAVVTFCVALVAPSGTTSPAHAMADVVIINEFLAVNESGLTDNTGATADWIELHNTTGASIDLGGWVLADGDASHLFAAGTTIGPSGYLVVFASDDVTRTTATEVHLPFKLSSTGEALTLTDPSGTVMNPGWPAPTSYPSQIADTSFGLDAGVLGYFSSPTPGVANGSGLGGLVDPVIFSREHGFLSSAQQVMLDTTTPSATIRYTLDGSTPTDTNGTIIAPGAAITIDETTVLRAVAYRAGWITSPVETRTWIFTSDVVDQSASPPPGWPADDAVNGQDFDYAMDPNVVNAGRSTVENALKAIPSISVVTDLDNLFDPVSGIYVNANNRGADWERPASIELIDPSGAEAGFDINGGIRMRGGFSRNANNPKHSFRLFFRDEYEGDLIYPLFGAEGTDRFEKVDLRTSQNYAWSWRRSTEASFMDELWSRDTQAAMAQPYTRSRFYHLYLNGQYWGLFMTQERVSDAYAEGYFGGAESDYDIVKRGQPDATVEASDGTLDAFTSLYPMVSDLFVTDTEYAQIAAQVDLENLADYYLLQFFSGDFDGSPSWFFRNSAGERWGRSNNWYALRHRAGIGDAGRWQFFDHDSEHSLCAPSGPGLRENVDTTTPWNLQSGVLEMSPGYLHEALITHPAYRQVFADRVQLHMVDAGGVLTVASSNARLDVRVAEVTGAIEAESARWGDGPESSSAIYGRSEWDNGVQRLRACFSQRQSIVEAQLRADDLWPAAQAPTIAPASGAVAYNTAVTLDAGGQSGTIWYTTDGSDPRGLDGSPAVTAQQWTGGESVTDDLTIRARILSNDGWSTLAESTWTLSGPVGPPRILLNEYNAVSPAGWLGGGSSLDTANGTDATLGRIVGNGGDWFELIVVEDELDVRGMSIEIWSQLSGVQVRNARLTFANDDRLSRLRAGTILTVSEDIADDWSYNPPAGDWHINLQANNADAGSGFTALSQTNFTIDNNDTRIGIFDAAGRPEALRTGEATAGVGVGDAEVFKLEAAPSSAVSPTSADYADGTSSTWGLPNVWAGGASSQDLTNTRLDFGDVNCDGAIDLLDALFVSQFQVGLRSATPSCPLSNPGTQLVVAPGDVGNDGSTDLLDALFISQCQVGLPNRFCP